MNRVGATTSKEEENTLKKSTADRAYKNDGFTLMSSFSQEPLLVRILLWIKSILFDTDIENVYNKAHLFIKAYCDFTDEDIAGLPDMNQTEVITLLTRRLYG